LTEGYEGFSRISTERAFSIVSAGFVFFLIGALFVYMPTLFDNIVFFFRNFGIVPIPNIGIAFIAPTRPGAHVVVYRAVERFSFVWALFQIVVLALRFVARSPVSKKAETASNIVYWLGAGYLVYTLLTAVTTLTVWFTFWSMIITVAGLALIIRAIILASTSLSRSF
jgi:hypothetical protein